METITSRRNPAIMQIRELKKRAARDALGLAFVEGRRSVADALAAGADVRLVCVSERFAGSGWFARLAGPAGASGARVVKVPDQVYASVSDTAGPQGLLAVVGIKNTPARELAASKNGVRRLLVLDGVSDPGNAGTMLRTAEAAGFDGAILAAGCVDLYEPKTMRATMGAVFRLPAARGADLRESLAALRAAGFGIYASAAAGAAPGRGSDCFARALRPGSLALVVGGEARGVAPGILQECDGTLSIPMPGGAESLNAAVAAGILMYEIYRRANY